MLLLQVVDGVLIVIVVHAAGGHDLLLGHFARAGHALVLVLMFLLYQVFDVKRQVVRGHRVDGYVLFVRQRLGGDRGGRGVPAGQLELRVHREVVMMMVMGTLRLLQQRLYVLWWVLQVRRSEHPEREKKQ